MTGPCYIVIPVHNRRAITLACLRGLREQGVLQWATPIVVDDGSTDGTGDALRAEFPAAEILRGPGNLFWTGATALGMQHALALGASFVFWLNDDCDPLPGSLALLRRTAAETGGAAGGVCTVPSTEITVYGGFKKGPAELEFLAAAPGELVPCDALNGNLVCFTRAAIEAAGLPDARGLPHAFGDTDYTLRVHRAGFPVVLVGDARATAVPNNPMNNTSWLVGGITATQLWQNVLDIRSYAYLPAHWRFNLRHWGLRGAARCAWLLVKRVPFTFALLLLPLAWRRALWAGKSRRWQEEKKLREALGP